MNYKKLLIAAIVILFAGIAVYSVRGVVNPYVTFKQAMKEASHVQILGTLYKSVPTAHFEGYYTFTLIDKDGTMMNIMHKGLKPQNFDHSTQVAAIGRYNTDTKTFDADKLLLKCPSRYKEMTK